MDDIYPCESPWERDHIICLYISTIIKLTSQVQEEFQNFYFTSSYIIIFNHT